MARRTALEDALLPPRYENVRRVGRGGMGDIYRATDSTLGRDVAVKVLAERYAEDEGVRNRFKREALAAARLSGAPSTVTIFDVGEHEERPFIVMEYLPGGSLEDRLEEEDAQEIGRAVAWLEQAAAALDVAHRVGIVHRDVKPANLLLDEDGNVHVADFGIASAAGLDSLTKTGTVLGTAGYLAPEQALGERATPATDRYALAVVGYELLTGTRPFENDTATAEAAGHVHAPVPPISDYGLPEELDDVFERALAKDPEERFPTCADFVAELRDALARAAKATQVIPAAPRRRRLRPDPLLGAIALALLLAGAALAVFVAAGDDETATPTTAPEPPRTVVTTVVQTQTQPGTTQQVTVTATLPAAGGGEDEEAEEPEQPPAEPPAEPPAQPTGGGTVNQGIALTDESTSLLGRDDARALALALQAIPMLEGRHRLYEAYARYDAGRALANLGRCEEALAQLRRSEQIQGPRAPITDAIQDCGG